MVSVRIEGKTAFRIVGMKTWIPDTETNSFGPFWQNAHKEGHIDRIKRLNAPMETSQTKSAILGLSCTEEDPTKRSFWFYIAVETNEAQNRDQYEIYKVKPYTWAIFQSDGSDFNALMECEMYAWKTWLKDNGTYIHDNGPELEVYFNEKKIEYWLPIRKKQIE